MPTLDTQALIADRVDAIRDYHTATGIIRAEIDVSGGIDSAVVLQLVCRAIGEHQVTAVYTGIHSSQDSLDRARAAARAAGPADILGQSWAPRNVNVKKPTASSDSMRRREQSGPMQCDATLCVGLPPSWP